MLPEHRSEVGETHWSPLLARKKGKEQKKEIYENKYSKYTVAGQKTSSQFILKLKTKFCLQQIFILV